MLWTSAFICASPFDSPADIRFPCSSCIDIASKTDENVDNLNINFFTDILRVLLLLKTCNFVFAKTSFNQRCEDSKIFPTC